MILFFAAVLWMVSTSSRAQPIDVDSKGGIADDITAPLWLPNLREVNLGGQTVAEFVISSNSQKKASPDGGKREQPLRSRPFVACKDSSASITLTSHGQVGDDELILKTSAPRLGLFDIEADVVEVKGSCCWELFDRAGFIGKMLRLCPGKYGPNVLGDFAARNAIRSLRVVDFLSRKGAPHLRRRTDPEER